MGTPGITLRALSETRSCHIGTRNKKLREFTRGGKKFAFFQRSLKDSAVDTDISNYLDGSCFC